MRSPRPPAHESSPRLPDEAFAYERVAEEITRCIAQGTLRPGDRIPSVRDSAVQWGVSIPTVLQAYRLLEARRAIQARPRSGYFVLGEPPAFRSDPRSSRASVGPSAVATGDLIVRFQEAVADPHLVPLATALPDPQLLPTARLARLLGAVARRDSVRSAVFSSPSGAEELRREIARRSLATRAPFGPEDVIVTAGCAEAIMLGLQALTRPGDTVAVESPAYYGTLQAMDVLGLRALHIPTSPHDGIDVESLDAALRDSSVAAVVVTPTGQNPLGSVMPEARRRDLATVLDMHRVPAIEDETWAELHFGVERPPSLRAFARTAAILSCGSFSKTLASAYRVGWIIPGRLRAEILRLKAATSVATAMPTQLAIAELVRSGGYDHHLRKLKARVQVNLGRMTAEIVDGFVGDVRVSSPAAGFVLWVELPNTVNALTLYRRCAQRGVSIAPGPIFSAAGEHENFVRLNGGLLWSPSVESALRVIADEVRRLHERAGTLGGD